MLNYRKCANVAHIKANVHKSAYNSYIGGENYPEKSKCNRGLTKFKLNLVEVNRRSWYNKRI